LANPINMRARLWAVGRGVWSASSSQHRSSGLEDRRLKKVIERRDRCGIGTCLDDRGESEFKQYLVLRHRGRSEPLLLTMLRKPIAARRRDAEFEFLLHPLRVSAQWQGTTNCPRMRYADPDPWPTRHFLNRFVPQPAGTPMAVLWARHERIGFEMVKKSIEHSIASGRWGNPFTRAVINEPAEPRLHAPVR
jgi:hypothetical protein